MHPADPNKCRPSGTRNNNFVQPGVETLKPRAIECRRSATKTFKRALNFSALLFDFMVQDVIVF